MRRTACVRARQTHEFYGSRPHISRFSRWLAGVGMLKSRSSLNELERNFGTVLRIPNPKRTLTRSEYGSRARRSPPCLSSRVFFATDRYEIQMYRFSTSRPAGKVARFYRDISSPPPLPILDSLPLSWNPYRNSSWSYAIASPLPREKSRKATRSSHRRKLSRNAGQNNDDQRSIHRHVSLISRD